MASDEDIYEALTAIYSRLGVLDGKASLNIRANRPQMLGALERLIADNSPLGQIYLFLDGKRTQTEIGAKLKELGLAGSHFTVSKRIELAAENGIAELVPDRGPGNVYRQTPEMESILSLSSSVRKWLKASGEPYPAAPRRSVKRPRRSA